MIATFVYYAVLTTILVALLFRMASGALDVFEEMLRRKPKRTGGGDA